MDGLSGWKGGRNLFYSPTCAFQYPAAGWHSLIPGRERVSGRKRRVCSIVHAFHKTQYSTVRWSIEIRARNKSRRARRVNCAFCSPPPADLHNLTLIKLLERSFTQRQPKQAHSHFPLYLESGLEKKQKAMRNRPRCKLLRQKKMLCRLAAELPGNCVLLLLHPLV